MIEYKHEPMPTDEPCPENVIEKWLSDPEMVAHYHQEMDMPYYDKLDIMIAKGDGDALMEFIRTSLARRMWDDAEREAR